MKKLFFAAASIAAILCSCQKEEANQNSGKLVFNASTELARTTLGADDAVLWEQGDIISINGAQYSATSGGSSSTSFIAVTAEAVAAGESPKYKAYYPASISNLKLPSVQMYGGLRNNPMYAESDGTDLQFKNLCGLLELKIKGSKAVKSIFVSSSGKALSNTFSIQQDGSGFKAVASTKSDGVMLDCGAGVALSETGTTFHIAVPAETYKKMKFIITATDESVCQVTSANDITISRNSIQPVNITASNFAPALLNGVFTVNASGKKVQFSRGLLFWDGFAGRFDFEPNQYFSIPAELDGASGNSWGGYSYGMHQSYFNYAADPANAIKQSKYTPAASEKFFACDGGAIEGWTILSKDEWWYLITGRTVNGGTGINKTYRINPTQRITVDGNGFSGVFIYPENYTGSYNESTWAAVNAAGIIYLPACGQCNRANQNWVGNLKGKGRYFCSDKLVTTANPATATCFLFDKDKGSTTPPYVVEWTDCTTSTATTVRLVKVVE